MLKWTRSQGVGNGRDKHWRSRQKSGCTHLRFYKEAGVLPKVSRVNDRRRYDDKTIRMIEVFGFAQRAGFSLAEIKALFNDAEPGRRLGERWRRLGQAKLGELDRLMAHVSQMREAIELGLACGCDRLEDCVIARPSENSK